jgi:putative glutamine amidotransferase
MRFLVCFFSCFLYCIFANARQHVIGIVPDTREVLKQYKYDDYRISNYGYWMNQGVVDNISTVCSEVGDFVYIILPYQPHKTKDYARMIDGVIMTGGGNEVDRWGFERELVFELKKRKKPIFGICLGMQHLNVMHGGDLAKVVDKIKDPLKHYYGNHLVLAHDVKLERGSLIYKILNKDVIQVNTHHNWMIDNAADNVKITGFAPDGVPEVLEMPDYKGFLLGVQWHPEFLLSDDDKKIFLSFCSAVRAVK